MRAREMEYRLYRASTTLQTAYINAENYEKSKELQNKQNEVYKKWKFYNRMRKEMEKINDEQYYKEKSNSRHSN